VKGAVHTRGGRQREQRRRVATGAGHDSACTIEDPPRRNVQDFGMGYSQSKATLDLCFNVLVRRHEAYFAAPVRGRRAV